MKRAGFVLAILLLAPAAHAAMVTLTEGALFVWPFDTTLNATGHGLTVYETGPFALPPQVINGQLVYPLTLGGGAASGGEIQLGATSCTFRVFDAGSLCGVLTFVSAPLAAPPADWPGTQAFVRPAVPFTVSGHLALGDGVELLAHGSVDELFCLGDAACLATAPGVSGSPVIRYRFATAVPEPPGLMLSALAMLGAAWLVRRRR